MRSRLSGAIFQIKSNAVYLDGRAFVSGVGGPKFESRTSQIDRVANGLPPLQHFVKNSSVARAQ